MRANKRRKDFYNEIKPGTNIDGKWHQQSYLIKRKLGSGAIGSVYLCEYNGKLAALKISNQDASISVEVNVLKALQKVQGTGLGPYLLDVDDWEAPHGTIYSFYVMEYLRGEKLNSFIKRNGTEWIGVFMLQLLNDLDRLHQSGWVFGDLKIENIVVLASPPRVRLIDVGGTTQMGRSIKEFTEFYDRGYWGIGTRSAEPSYDLFALVMVFLAIFYPNKFHRSTDSKQLILHKIDQVTALNSYQTSLKKAVQGDYKSGMKMAQDITKLLYSRHKRSQTKRIASTNAIVPIIIEVGGILLIAGSYFVSSLLIL